MNFGNVVPVPGVNTRYTGFDQKEQSLNLLLYSQAPACIVNVHVGYTCVHLLNTFLVLKNFNCVGVY